MMDKIIDDNIQLKNKNIFGLVRSTLNQGGSLIGLIILCIIISILTPSFLSVNNILNVLRQISINSILAFGLTFVIILGGIDLSIGSVLAVSGTFTCGFVADGMNLALALLIGLLIGLVFGTFNGFLISKIGMPSFIITLATMTIARGFAYIYTKGMPIRSQDESFNFIGNGYVGFIPFPIIILIVVLIISYLLLHKTIFGRYVYAIGGNREAAKYAGINILKVEITCFVISAIYAALSGIILAARMYSGQPTVGAGFEMDAIAAVVLGGTSFSGGSGRIIGSFFGALIIGVMNNGLNLLNVPFYYQLIIKGIVIIAAIYFDTVKKRK